MFVRLFIPIESIKIIKIKRSVKCDFSDDFTRDPNTIVDRARVLRIRIIEAEILCQGLRGPGLIYGGGTIFFKLK